MRYLLLLAILTHFTCYSQEENKVYTDGEAVSTTRRALLKVPRVTDQLKIYQRKAVQLFGITEESVPYLASAAIAIHGRVTTKYFKNFKYETEKYTITPLLEYKFKDEEASIELRFIKNF